MTSRRTAIAASLVLVVFGTGCSQEQPQVPSAGSGAAPDSPGAAIVVGQTPAAVNGAASIVILESASGQTFSPPDEKAVMDQSAEMFVPPVLFVQAGQTVEFRNSDEKLHNVNVRESMSKEQLFNVAIPMGGTVDRQLPQEGLFDVHCDIHPAMAAIIVSSPTPYAKTAEPDGTVEFDDVVPGRYNAVVYAGTAKLEQSVDVVGPRTLFTVKN